MQESSMELLWGSSHISGGNAAYVEELYETYLQDPNDVPEEWRTYFEKLPQVDGSVHRDVPHSTIRKHFAQIAKVRTKPLSVQNDTGVSEHERKQVRVIQLIGAYRQRGHQQADLDPLKLHIRPPVPDLDLHYHKLSGADFDTLFQTGSLFIGKDRATLREIVDTLEQTYSATVGAEFRIAGHLERREDAEQTHQRAVGTEIAAPEIADEDRADDEHTEHGDGES